MEKKRFFTEEEKATLRELVIANKDIVENRKSDVTSLAEKKKCWEFIANNFNSVGSHSKRTSYQLKKLWENMKFRRRADLAEVKREQMRTRGGAFVSTIREHPEFDSLGVDVELEGAMDSDTITLSNAYNVVGGVSMPTRNTIADLAPETTDEGEHRHDFLRPSTSGPQNSTKLGKKKTGRVTEEDVIRARRVEQLLRHDAELHSAKMKELQLRTQLMEEEMELKKKEVQLRMKYMEHQMKIQSELLEIELELKQKVLVKDNS